MVSQFQKDKKRLRRQSSNKRKAVTRKEKKDNKDKFLSRSGSQEAQDIQDARALGWIGNGGSASDFLTGTRRPSGRGGTRTSLSQDNRLTSPQTDAEKVEVLDTGNFPQRTDIPIEPQAAADAAEIEDIPRKIQHAQDVQDATDAILGPPADPTSSADVGALLKIDQPPQDIPQEQEAVIEQSQGAQFVHDKFGKEVVINATKEDLDVLNQSELAPEPSFLENGDYHVPANTMTSMFYKKVDEGDITQEQLEEIRKLALPFPITTEDVKEYQWYINDEGGLELASHTFTKTQMIKVGAKSTGAAVTTGALVANALKGVGQKAVVAGLTRVGTAAPAAGTRFGPVGIIAGLAVAALTLGVAAMFTYEASVAGEASDDIGQQRQRVMTIDRNMMTMRNRANAGGLPRWEALQNIREHNLAILTGIAKLKRMENTEWGKQAAAPHPYREKLARYQAKTFRDLSAEILDAVGNPDPEAIVPITDNDILGEAPKTFGLIQGVI